MLFSLGRRRLVGTAHRRTGGGRTGEGSNLVRRLGRIWQGLCRRRRGWFLSCGRPAPAVPPLVLFLPVAEGLDLPRYRVFRVSDLVGYLVVLLFRELPRSIELILALATDDPERK